MQLSQSALFYLSCASFLAGLLLSLFCDFLYMLRLWLIPYDIRYTVSAIQKLRSSRAKKGKQKKQKGLKVLVFLSDVLFCLVGAITLILLLYWLNNGVFRAAAPLCMAVGFWLWHVSLSKCVRIVLQWLAFGIETVLYTLVMPIKRLFALMARTYKKNAQKRHLKHLAKQRQSYTKQELQSIEKAAERLLPIYTKPRTQKGDSRAKQRKKAV